MADDLAQAAQILSGKHDADWHARQQYLERGMHLYAHTAERLKEMSVCKSAAQGHAMLATHWQDMGSQNHHIMK